MRYLKTYEGLFDFFKSKDRLSDEQIVKDYIKYFSNKMLDYDVVNTGSDSVFLSTYEFKVNNLEISFDEKTPDNKPNIILDGRILKVNQNMTLDLQRALKDIDFRNLEFTRQIRLHLNGKKNNPNRFELSDRIIEFEVVKSDGSIDEISLRSLLEYYDSSFNPNIITAMEYLHNKNKEYLKTYEEANFDIKHIIKDT